MKIKLSQCTLSLQAIALVLLIGCATATIMGGPIVPRGLMDGVYDGQAKNGPVKVKASVKIQAQRIAEITLTEHRNWRGGPAEEVIPARIIDAQSTKVDAVSGATASSIAIMNAVEDAVHKAR